MLRRDGFVHLRNVVEPSTVKALGCTFEDQLATFAADNKLPRDVYLSVINKWTQWNLSVAKITEVLGPLLRPAVAQALGCDAAIPVAATVFRKSKYTQPTHPHQDIAYSRFPGTQMFQVTTWVPLLLGERYDTMAFARGSHRLGIQPVKDAILSTLHNRAAEGDGGVKTDHGGDLERFDRVPILDIKIGDCLLFDSRVYHWSTPVQAPPCSKTGDTASASPPGHTEFLRLAIGIQWLGPGGLDGVVPGSYPRWPASDVPPPVDLERERLQRQFSMDTAGFWLKQALCRAELLLMQEPLPARKSDLVDTTAKSTLALARHFSDRTRDDVKDALRRAGCPDIDAAQQALYQYDLMRQAARFHHGQSQGSSVFGALLNHVIDPILGGLTY